MYHVSFFYLAYYFILQTHLSHTAAYYCSMHSISILPLTVKRRICILVLYYCEYVNWIHEEGDGDETHKKLREPRHGMSGDNISPTSNVHLYMYVTKLSYL